MCPDGMRWKVRVGGAVFFRVVTGVLPQRRGSLRAGQRPAGGSSAVQEEHAEPSGLCVPPPHPLTIPALSAAPQARASHRMASVGVRLCAAACGVRGVPAAKNSSQQERPGRASLRCPRPRSPRALLVSCRLCPGPGSVPARPSARALGCRASSRRAAVIRPERVQALTSPPPESPTGSRRFPLPSLMGSLLQCPFTASPPIPSSPPPCGLNPAHRSVATALPGPGDLQAGEAGVSAPTPGYSRPPQPAPGRCPLPRLLPCSGLTAGPP